MARPTATRCRWPPESAFGLRSSNSSIPRIIGGLPDSFFDLLLGIFTQLEAEGHVLVNGHVRIECVVLKDHCDVPVLRRNVVDEQPIDVNFSLGDFLEAGNHPQHRRFAAARGSYEDHELAVAYPNIRVFNRNDLPVENLADILEYDFGHG